MQTLVDGVDEDEGCRPRSEMGSPSEVRSEPMPPGVGVGTVLSGAIDRWHGAANRLNLTPEAAACGALLLSAELDLDVAVQLMGNDAQRIAPRRSDLLRTLSEAFGSERAFNGLAGLESRGIAAPVGGYAGPWLLAELELSKSVRNYCLGAAPGASTDVDAYAPLPRLALAIGQIADRCATNPRSFLVVIRGPRGSGRDALLAALARRLNTQLIVKTVLDLRQVDDQLEPELSSRAPAWDSRRADPSSEDYENARRWLGRGQSIAFALVDAHQDTPEVNGRLVLLVNTEPQDAEERRLGWTIALKVAGASADLVEEAAARLAARNQAGTGLATQAALLAGTVTQPGCGELVASIERSLSSLVQPSSLRGICIEQPQVPLSVLVASEQVTSALQRLLKLCSAYTFCSVAGRHGVKALFCGGSGTGKTLAARAIAHEVARPLYRVDLATIISKWIGETEKNLRDAMVAAGAVGAVLLFDEGDALFGKRGEVSRGSDRYANMEVSYLLQAIETYEGIAIVTTNLRGNVDKAFERRFDTCIEFPRPEVEQRVHIWHQELGDFGSALDPEFLLRLAQRADLNGGNIAAAARLARVLAFERGDDRVLPSDVQTAVQAEFVKQGSTVRAHHWVQAPGTGRLD